MNKDAVQRLREPAAWILLGAAAVQLLAGLVNLFLGKLSFSAAALWEISGGSLFTDVTVVGMVVLAVLLVTMVGAGPAPQARVIVTSALVVLGGMAIFGLVSWLAALTVDGDFGTGKFAAFLYGAAKLAVIGLGTYLAYTVHHSLAPRRGPQGAVQQPGGQPYGDYGGYAPGQEQAYGRPGQQPYGAQPSPPPQPYQQPYEHGQVYGQQQYYEQAPEQPGQAAGQPGDAEQTQQLGHQSGHPYPYGYGQQQYGQQGEGDWTQAYGSGERPAQPYEQGAAYGRQQYSQQPPGQEDAAEPRSGEEGDQNWYRDDRRHQ